MNFTSFPSGVPRQISQYGKTKRIVARRVYSRTLRYTENKLKIRGTDRRGLSVSPNLPMTDTSLPVSKQCAYCQQHKPLSEFRRRTGKRSKGQSRRGACRDCRKILSNTTASGLQGLTGPAVSAAKKTGQTARGSAGPAAQQAAKAVLAGPAVQHDLKTAQPKLPFPARTHQGRQNRSSPG